MKKKIVIPSILALAVMAGAGTFFFSSKGYCFNCESYLGKTCYSNFDCNSYQCNLSCRSLDRYSYEKKCY